MLIFHGVFVYISYFHIDIFLLIMHDFGIYFTRPMSSDTKVNSVDPRSYFYLRGFLEKAKNAGETIALVSTWVCFLHIFFK